MITIMCGDHYKLQSAGNGYVYLLTDLRGLRDVALSGDDALVFEKDLDAVETMLPHGNTDDILGYLWTHMDYELASRPLDLA